MDTMYQEQRRKYKNIKSGNILECSTGFASLSFRQKMVADCLQVNGFIFIRHALKAAKQIRKPIQGKAEDI